MTIIEEHAEALGRLGYVLSTAAEVIQAFANCVREQHAPPESLLEEADVIVAELMRMAGGISH